MEHSLNRLVYLRGLVGADRAVTMAHRHRDMVATNLGNGDGKNDMPQLGVSMFLIAVGAILMFAINVTMPGVSLYAVGVILLVVGILGAVASMLFWTSFAPFARRDMRDDVRLP